jgi:hypothetical protein
MAPGFHAPCVGLTAEGFARSMTYAPSVLFLLFLLVPAFVVARATRVAKT